jgi:hypothetical protein
MKKKNEKERKLQVGFYHNMRTLGAGRRLETLWHKRRLPKHFEIVIMLQSRR